MMSCLVHVVLTIAIYKWAFIMFCHFFVGDQLLMKTVAETTGRKLQKIKEDVNETGDLGIVAEVSLLHC